MSNVGQIERATQQRVVKLFREHLGYGYLGDWGSRPDDQNISRNRNIDTDLLSRFLEKLVMMQELLTGRIRLI